MQRRRIWIAAGTLAAAFIAGACTTGPGAGPTSGGGAASGSTAIPQPAPPGNLPLAPESKRVDIARPTFTNPLKITNPLFPVSSQASVLHLGTVDGQPLRTEVTTLPYTRIIEWDGQRVETQVSQYVLFAGGRIKEAAIDSYAQADDGSVWYFGEDVFRYADGVVFDTDGTWLTGKDGPAALIMPGKPAVGQTFRPENIPGLVFEEVSITTVDQTLDGPRGPVKGGLAAREIHRDGTTSEKLFAPGYGEFRTGSDTELETMALVVPTDALPGPVPGELAAIATSAGALFDATRANDWTTAAAQLDGLHAAWTAVRGGDVPKQIRESLDSEVAVLTTAVGGRNPAAAGQAAINALRLGLDLQLRHRPSTDVDLARMDGWGRQLLLDVAAAEPAGLIHGDVTSLKYVRDRVLATVNRTDLGKIDELIHQLAEASEGADLPAVTTATAALRAAVAAAKPAG